MRRVLARASSRPPVRARRQNNNNDRYNKVYICRVFGPKFKQFKVHGEWRGKTAAGSHKETEDVDGTGEEASAESHKGWLRLPNGDPQWFNNPQCVVVVVVVVLLLLLLLLLLFCLLLSVGSFCFGCRRYRYRRRRLCT